MMTLREQLEGSLALLDGRLCKDCRFYKKGQSAYDDRCERPRTQEDGIALVRGDEAQRNYCHTQRIGSPTDSNCGAAGRYFEAPGYHPVRGG